MAVKQCSNCRESACKKKYNVMCILFGMTIRSDYCCDHHQYGVVKDEPKKMDREIPQQKV